MRSGLLVVLVGCSACGVGSENTTQSSEAALLVDGSTTGPAGFLFLAPIGTRRHAQPGETTSTLRPEVQIDEIDPATGAVLVPGPRFDGTLHAERRCDDDDDDDDDDAAYFEARWRTARHTHRVGAVHRVRVLLDSHEVGFADVRLVRKAGHHRANSPGMVSLVLGQTLSIRFVLNQAAVDQDGDGVFDWRDNCPALANPGQADSVGNGIGDACRCESVTCGALDECHVAGVCEPTTGLCTQPSAPDGTACAQGHCTAGACVPDRCTTFALSSSVTPTGAEPWLMTTVDFDGDLDLISGEYFGGVSSLRNDGAGTFTRIANVSSPLIYSLAVADMDVDGLADVMVGNYLFSTVAIHRGLGGGVFAAASTVPVTDLWGAWPVDVNADGRPDLVVGRVSGLLDVRLQQPAGGFAAPTTIDVRNGSTRPMDLAAADLDGDGLVELVIANSGVSLTVLPGTGGGSFGTPRHFLTGNSPGRVALADLDGDGRLDAATFDAVANTITVLHGNGNATFTLAATLPMLNAISTAAPGGLALVDYDGDGQRDIVAASWRANAVLAFFRQGTGWSAATTLATRTGPNSLVAGDFDGDGKVDLAVPFQSTNTVEVMLNRCQ